MELGSSLPTSRGRVDQGCPPPHSREPRGVPRAWAALTSCARGTVLGREACPLGACPSASNSRRQGDEVGPGPSPFLPGPEFFHLSKAGPDWWSLASLGRHTAQHPHPPSLPHVSTPDTPTVPVPTCLPSSVGLGCSHGRVFPPLRLWGFGSPVTGVIGSQWVAMPAAPIAPSHAWTVGP